MAIFAKIFGHEVGFWPKSCRESVKIVHHLPCRGINEPFHRPPINLIFGPKPVSYTHLDVYKRQVQHRAVKDEQRALFHERFVLVSPAHGQLAQGVTGNVVPRLYPKISA